MGVAELNKQTYQLVLRSIFYFYGDAASASLSEQIANEIMTHWNEPRTMINIGYEWFDLRFEIVGHYQPDICAETVLQNSEASNNYFRVEEFSINHVSSVDGIGCNTGYFKLDNLLNNSTTAAHEYGHTLGLEHPQNLDIRGEGQPGIMYPRGTICDPEFQYDPSALPSQPGGTLNPCFRKVLPADIDKLHLRRLRFNRQGIAIVGEFSSIFHDKHQPSK
ncbi:MAG TPA: hypothetical protein VKR32_16760 [Puia sp.]|nr:hypothetical protein [Puia sp.]